VDRQPGQAKNRDPLRLLRQGTLITLTIELALLALTGIWLVFNYRPSSAAFWNRVGRPRPVRARTPWIRLFHRDLSRLTVLTALLTAVVVTVDAKTNGFGRRKLALYVSASTMFAAMLFSSFTGFLLPWDQLALWAVRVGTNIKGFAPAFGPSVNFVLIGGATISKSTLWRWFIIHTTVLGILVPILVGVVVWLTPSRNQRSPDR
jgi:quinol-cytochrome oxidoreductase complex cytochrome b subunit